MRKSLDLIVTLGAVTVLIVGALTYFATASDHRQLTQFVQLGFTQQRIDALDSRVQRRERDYGENCKNADPKWKRACREGLDDWKKEILRLQGEQDVLRKK